MFLNKEKKLSGDATETPSSDPYISNAVEALRAEVWGINGNVIDITTYQARKISENIMPAVIVDETSQAISTNISNLEGLPLPQFVAKLREKRVRQLKYQPPKAA